MKRVTNHRLRVSCSRETEAVKVPAAADFQPADFHVSWMHGRTDN